MYSGSSMLDHPSGGQSASGHNNHTPRHTSWCRAWCECSMIVKPAWWCPWWTQSEPDWPSPSFWKRKLSKKIIIFYQRYWTVFLKPELTYIMYCATIKIITFYDVPLVPVNSLLAFKQVMWYCTEAKCSKHVFTMSNPKLYGSFLKFNKKKH